MALWVTEPPKVVWGLAEAGKATLQTRVVDRLTWTLASKLLTSAVTDTRPKARVWHFNIN